MAELRTVNPLVAGSSPALGAMINYIQDSNDLCIDCGVNTLLIYEYYMVHEHIWNQTGLGRYDGMLCISCLEKRINRPLNSKDFTNFPINTEPLMRSQLLTSRLTK